MSHVINDVLEDCINWYYLNCNCTKLIKDTVLEDCINWYYLNKRCSYIGNSKVLEDCINWYYLNLTLVSLVSLKCS